MGMTKVGCLSNAPTQVLMSIGSSPSPLSAKLCSKSVHRSVHDLELSEGQCPYHTLEAYI